VNKEQDGSQHPSPEILKNFAKKNKKIKVFHQDNFGAGYTRNKLLDLSNGAILVGLDADDRIYPSALERIIEKYNQDSRVGFVYSNQRVIDENGKLLYEGRKEKCHPFFDELIYFTHFPGHLRSFRKSSVKNLRFDVNLKTGQDWDFLLQLVPNTCKAHIPEFLYDYRINSRGLSRRTSKRVKLHRSVQLLKRRIIINNIYPNAECIDIIPIVKGEHAIYYNHIVDDKLKEMSSEAKEALMDYFLQYEGC